MKALILAGGYGTRLHPITLRTCKCVLPLAGVPNIIHIIRNLKAAGIRDVVISMNANQEPIKDVLGSGKRFGMKLTYITEKTASNKDKLGAIGAIKFVVDRVGTDDYIVIGADNFFHGLDLAKMIEYHKKRKADATIALYNLGDKSLVKKYGIAVLEKGDIVAFQEKPEVEDALSTLASALVYIVTKKFLDVMLVEYIKNNRNKLDRPGDLWAHFAKKIAISGFPFSGFWGDIGNSETYVNSNKEAMSLMENKISDSARISKDAQLSGNHIRIGDNVVVEGNVIIGGPVLIGDNCIIRNGSVIGPYAMLLKGVEIGEGCKISDSIIFENVKIGPKANIEGAIIDGKSAVGAGSIIERGAIIGYGSQLLENSRILPSSRIWPHITINQNAVIQGDIISDTGLIRDSGWLMKNPES